MNNNYYIVIKVDSVEGEENTRITEITGQELEVLWPLLCYIRDNFSGYFPTGRFLIPSDPSPEELYSKFLGWNQLISRIPEPFSGIKRLTEINVFSETPESLYM